MSGNGEAGFGDGQGREVSRYIRVGLREIEGGGEIRVQGHAPAAAHLRGPHGGVRAGALLTMLDNVGGLCGGLAALPEGWVVSTNLSARSAELEHVGPMRIDARVLRQGRSSVLTGVQIHDEGAHDALVVDGVLTSAILVPQSGPPQWTRPLVLDAGDPPPEPVPDIPQWLGARPIDASTIEMKLAESLRNPWGILHGGAVASFVDLAAEHVTGGITADVVLHFLAPNRIGPVRATARAIGSRADGTVLRVEVRDHGADRVTALAVVTARTTP
ncbi:MAG TPA: PaaI family thioesterase [Acidimicrobiia bacterium]|jgi:acyl-coenzyme A thioesterase PaaI-like protein|nr:PaaI family thioesterase [Acidimicrobiia bacterium]